MNVFISFPRKTILQQPALALCHFVGKPAACGWVLSTNDVWCSTRVV